MKINLKKLAVSILIPLAVGFLSSLLIKDSVESYAIFNKPPLSPPAAVFGPVWTVLYILMGISTYLILNSDVSMEQKQRAIFPFIVQLVLNFFWSIIFFNFEAFYAAFIWLVMMLVWILITFFKYKQISKPASYLLLPYIIWVSFAGYLNLAIAILN